MEKIRIQKFLSQQGICSRRQAEEYIRAGELLVNGLRAKLGDRVNLKDEVILKGEALRFKTKIEQEVIMFNKPPGVETTLRAFSEAGKKTLANFKFSNQRVFPVGRLDRESRGLLLLTNDGALAHELMHPSFEHKKYYEVLVDKFITKKMIDELSSGVLVDGKKTKPCKIELLEKNQFKIILEEGRKRQIRRMCDSVGLTVIDLKRTKIKNLPLGNLKEGAFRVLTKEEVKGIC